MGLSFTGFSPPVYTLKGGARDTMADGYKTACIERMNMERPCAWKKYTPEQLVELEKICSGYKEFISENKTERLCVRTGAALAEQAGYVELGQAVAAGKTLKPGDKVYAVNHGKTLMLMQIGKRPLQEGFNILGAHVDSPRLDLKQNPAFEAGDMAYLDTTTAA